MSILDVYAEQRDLTNEWWVSPKATVRLIVGLRQEFVQNKTQGAWVSIRDEAEMIELIFDSSGGNDSVSIVTYQ